MEGPTTRAEAELWTATLIAGVERGAIARERVPAMVSERTMDLLTTASLSLPPAAVHLARGRRISAGVASGRAYFDIDALLAAGGDDPKVLITPAIGNRELAAAPQLTAMISERGDPSAHAAIVCRASGLPVVSGIAVGSMTGTSSRDVAGAAISEGDWVSVDATTGDVHLGRSRVEPCTISAATGKLLALLQSLAVVAIHANADTARETVMAARLGATGFDPRTEHMALDGGSLRALQRALLAPHDRARHLRPFAARQRAEMAAVYRVSGQAPVSMRFLDPPVHEFIPETPAGIAALAADLGMDDAEMRAAIDAAREVNPMMGMRGVRLLLARPELVRAQTAAALNAACDVAAETGELPPVMLAVPMVVSAAEVVAMRRIVDQTARRIGRLRGRDLNVNLGAMVETPRAALLAGEIVPFLDYISFGTNDLTGQVLALSRGDVYDRFLTSYLDSRLLPHDPFVELDPAVMELVERTCRAAQALERPMPLGLCGEQSSAPSTLRFAARVGLTSLSVNAADIPRSLLHSAQLGVELGMTRDTHRNDRSAPGAGTGSTALGSRTGQREIA